jgi:hypothetical protein
MARPTKLTPEITEKICMAIRAGNYAKIAAGMAGISEATYYSWLDQAKEPDAEPEFLEFLESVERAEAEAEIGAVARIRQAADNGTWQAAGWLLERKHGERWGRNDKLRQEISGVDGAPIQLSLEEAKKAVLAFLDEGDSIEFINSGTDTTEAEGTTPNLA